MNEFERVNECIRIIAEAQEVLCEVALPDLLDIGMPPWDHAAIRLQLELQLDQTLTALLLLSSWERYKREIYDMGIDS
ncbi:MAG TPA: hypothetical protein VJQ57_13055 [Acidimicrobiia bacterium]|nr:hypothetical protein [Acidimicrobiia bacterium]